MEITVNIKDKEGREYGAHVLHKFKEGYVWAYVIGEKDQNLPTIIKNAIDERWMSYTESGGYYSRATFPFSEDDISAD